MFLRKSEVVRAFDRANRYDAYARIQQIAADRLAERIAAGHHAPERAALEIGCGTGALSAALLARWPELALTVSDVAPAMVARARARLGDGPRLGYAVVDGENPPPLEGGYALIASSLAFQWFEALDRSLARLAGLLAPGGRLAFTTLCAGTFAEWRHARAVVGLPDATRVYPTTGELEGWCPAGCSLDIDSYTLVEEHPDGLAFLRGLKAIGAATPWAPAARATPAALRRAIAAFEANGARITYDIAEVVVCRSDAAIG